MGTDPKNGRGGGSPPAPAAGMAVAVGLAAAGAVAVFGAFLRQRRRIELAGKVVLVTGGSRGLGLVLARRLAAEGAYVALCARDAEDLESARSQIRGETGRDVVSLTADLTDRAQAADVIRQVTEKLGPVDVLINNAGIIKVGPMETMTEADYEEAMALHFWAPFHTVHAVLPSMRQRGAGRIVNISSIGGKIAVPHLLPYSASKFALTGFSEGLRAELLPQNIFVTTVCPGLMRTGSPRNAEFKGQHEKEYAWFAVSDSLPFLSQSAGSAAERILDALRHGDAEVVTTLPAQVAVVAHGLMPGVVSDALSVAHRLLPEPGGIGTDSRAGSESETPLTRSPLTALTRKAEQRNNQLDSSPAA